MSQFGPDIPPNAINFLLNNEDAPRRYNVSIDNNGGRVIAGINSLSFPEQEAAIEAVAQNQRGLLVDKFYLAEFWASSAWPIGGIIDQDVANRVLDMAVNAGEPNDAKLLQRAINSLLRAPAQPLAVDGHIGPATLEAANSVAPDSLLAAFRQERVNYYNAVVTNHPADAVYKAAWVARAEA